MCPPPCGPRRRSISRPRKDKKFPDSWMNEKRVFVDNAVISADGKTLVKVDPALTGEYSVPASCKRVLVDAFRKSHLNKVIFHPDVVTPIHSKLFYGSYIEWIQVPSGHCLKYSGRVID